MCPQPIPAPVMHRVLRHQGSFLLISFWKIHAFATFAGVQNRPTWRHFGVETRKQKMGEHLVCSASGFRNSYSGVACQGREKKLVTSLYTDWFSFYKWALQCCSIELHNRGGWWPVDRNRWLEKTSKTADCVHILCTSPLKKGHPIQLSLVLLNLKCCAIPEILDYFWMSYLIRFSFMIANSDLLNAFLKWIWKKKHIRPPPSPQEKTHTWWFFPPDT